MRDELDDLINQLDEDKPKEEQTASAQPAQVPAPQVLPPLAATLAQEPSFDQEFVKELVSEYKSVGQEILTSWRADRAEAQDAIDLCKNEIEKAISANTTPGRVYVEGLIQAIEVKSSTNTNAVKLIETGSKLAAAIKGRISINNNVTNISSGINAELNSILLSDLPDV